MIAISFIPNNISKAATEDRQDVGVGIGGIVAEKWTYGYV
jgi:hypothetical protein